jgi:hypothetical protein
MKQYWIYFKLIATPNDQDRSDRLQQQLRDLDTLCSFLEEGHRLGSPAAVELAGLIKIRCLLAASQRYLETRSALLSQKIREMPASMERPRPDAGAADKPLLRKRLFFMDSGKAERVSIRSRPCAMKTSHSLFPYSGIARAGKGANGGQRLDEAERHLGILAF